MKLPKTGVICLEHRDEEDGFHFDILVNGKPHHTGKFATLEARAKATDDLIRMRRGAGFKDDYKVKGATK